MGSEESGLVMNEMYAVRLLTEPAWETKTRAGVRVVAYEIVDTTKSIHHAHDQVIYTTKDQEEAWRYADMLNKQHNIERGT